MSEELQEFQRRLLDEQPCLVRPQLSGEVFHAISVLFDISGAEMGRQGGVTRNTANAYIRSQKSPQWDRAVRMLDKLGFEVTIRKRM